LSGEVSLVGYFGYGSLVNRATLRTDIVAAYPARLEGWRRYWRRHPKDTANRDGVNPAVLTAGRDAKAGIDGMLVIDRLDNLPSVDEREHRYQRVEIGNADLSFYAEAPEIAFPLYIYEARFEEEERHSSRIIRSYLDAVMQGFHREFGEAGLHRFIKETDDFHHLFHEDRHAPAYPRAVTLAADEQQLFETVLQLGRVSE
jgi:hypothetical protein